MNNSIVVKVNQVFGKGIFGIANVKYGTSWINGIRVFVDKVTKEVSADMPMRMGSDGKYYYVFNPGIDVKNNIITAVINTVKNIYLTSFEKKSIDIHKFLHGNETTFDDVDVQISCNSGVRFVDYHGYRYIVQNPNKVGSNHAELAKSGRKITWITSNGSYVGKIFDGMFSKMVLHELSYK